MNFSSLGKLKTPFVAFLLFAIPAFFWVPIADVLSREVHPHSLRIMFYTLLVLLVVAGAWGVIRLVDVFFWEGVMAPRLGGKVPKLLKDVVGLLIVLIAISIIVGGVFDLDVTGLWATSGAVGLVMGLALQSMIADVFSGIALNVDRPFKIHDWITVHQRGLPNTIGEVVEINWRSTRIQQKDGLLVVIPNGRISTMMITNLCEPMTRSRFRMNFLFDFAVPTERALRILSAGALSAKGILLEPKAKVRIIGPDPDGIQYEVRYWIEPADISPSKARHAVSLSIFDHLHQAGLTPAYDKKDIYVAPMPARHLDSQSDCTALLKRVDLFSELSDDERQLLSKQLDAEVVQERSAVVKNGAPGRSMYILVEGLLDVYVDGDNGDPLLVNRIRPGDFFGEMSLLTGEPRSATIVAATSAVIYEITKEHLLPLLERRPQIAELLTEAVAARQIHSKTQLAKAQTPTEVAKETEGLATALLGKMRALFNLKRVDDVK